MRVAEAGRLGGDHDVAGEDEFQPAGHRQPVDGRDDGLAEGLDAVEQFPYHGEELQEPGCGLLRRHGRQVGVEFSHAAITPVDGGPVAADHVQLDRL